MGFTIRPEDIATVALDTIKHLEPETSVAWVQEVRNAVRDCDDRPNENKPRKIILQMEMIPVVHPNGTLTDEIAADFQIKSVLPPKRSRAVSLQSQQNGDVIFRKSNPSDINQPGLFDGEEEETSQEEGEGN